MDYINVGYLFILFSFDAKQIWCSRFTNDLPLIITFIVIIYERHNRRTKMNTANLRNRNS